MRGMELWRPDWVEIMKGCCFDNPRASELVSVTQETARLALSAIKEQNARDYYHNFGAAARELQTVVEMSEAAHSPQMRTEGE